MPQLKAGCQTCKSRRIKCDQAKPICQRCAKARRVCMTRNPTKPAHFSIHLGKTYASGETNRPRGPRPRSSLTIFRPTPDVPSIAVVAYYHCLRVLEDLPTVSACMLECVITLRASRGECIMVDLAISAVTLAIFSRTQQHPSAARVAVHRYSRLLRVAQEQITRSEILQCDEKRYDELLLVVVFMAWYETATHQPANLESRSLPTSLHSWSHYDGPMAILTVWIHKRRDNSPSDIVKQARRGLLRSAFFRNLSLPDWVQDGSRFGEHGIDLSFDSILVQAVNLRHEYQVLEQTISLEDPVVGDLISKARKLDESCQEWAAQIPSEWSYQARRIPSPWPREDFYTSTVYIYTRHAYAAVWVQYFAVRILIHSTLLSLLRPTHLPQFHVYEDI